LVEVFHRVAAACRNALEQWGILNEIAPYFYDVPCVALDFITIMTSNVALEGRTKKGRSPLG